jgi:hypothetical protein
MKQGDSKKLDPRTLLALSKARPAPPRRAVPILIALTIVVVGLGIIGYLIWPDDPPRVTVVAYDTVAHPDDTIALHGRVEKEEGEKSNRLGGLEIRFEVPASHFGESAATENNGATSVEWHVPEKVGLPIEFTVIRELGRQKRVARDSGHVFIYPANTPLLVVDADHALADADEETLQAASLTKLKEKEGAASTLRGLSGGYKIVYLTAVMDRPDSYRKLRIWLSGTGLATRLQLLPDGPLLGPYEPLGQGDREIFLAGQVQALKKDFPKLAIGIAGRAQEAKVFQGEGLKTYLIGEAGDAPDDVTVAGTWAELAKQFK